MSGRGSGLSPSRFQGNFVVSERPNFLGRIFADAGCDYGREGNPGSSQPFGDGIHMRNRLGYLFQQLRSLSTAMVLRALYV